MRPKDVKRIPTKQEFYYLEGQLCLTDRQQIIFEMHHKEGKSIQECADSINISTRTAQRESSEILHKLRQF